MPSGDLGGFISKLSPNLQAILGAVVFLLGIAPEVADLWGRFRESRSEKRRLEIQQAYLENLKLRYEIEQLRKENPVAQLDHELELVFPPTTPKPERKPTITARPPRWLASRPRLSLVVLWIVRFILWVPEIYFVILFVGTFIDLLMGTTPDTNLYIITALIAAALSWLFYRWIRGIGRLRRRLKEPNLPLVPSPSTTS